MTRGWSARPARLCPATTARGLPFGELPASERQIEQGLRRKVVDVLAADALADGGTSTADLVHLVDDQAIRWGFGVNATTHHLDQIRQTDIATIRAAPKGGRLATYAALLEPWLVDGRVHAPFWEVHATRVD